MMKKVNRECPICKNTIGEILHNQSFFGADEYNLPKEYDIVCCENCGFVYADSPADQNSYSDYYARFSKYEDAATSHQEIITEDDYIRIHNMFLKFSEFIVDRNTKILDIGCGMGACLQEMKRNNYTNLTGMDISKNALKNLKKKGISTVCSDMFSIDESNKQKKYDCIVSTCVLEHVLDLNLAVDKICSLLNDNGIFYIEVPAADKYHEAYSVPYQIFNMEHINHFDLNAFQNLLCSRGFEFIKSGYRKDKIAEGRYNIILYAFFRKSNLDNYLIKYNDLAKKSVLKYIELSEKDNNILEIINYYVNNNEKIFIWGTGSFCSRLLVNSKLKNCNICSFIDNNKSKQGQSIDGIIINSPEILKLYDYPILICVEMFGDDILNQIESMGINNKVTLLQGKVI